MKQDSQGGDEVLEVMVPTLVVFSYSSASALPYQLRKAVS